MDNKKEILELLEKSLNGKSSDAEEHRLEELLGMENSLSGIIVNESEKQETEDRMLKGITSSIKKSGRRKMMNASWVKIAALLIIFLAVGLLVKYSNKENVGLLSNKIEVNDLQPGRDRAVLTLSDGSKIVLDSKENRVLASENGIIIKERDGHVEYDYTQLDSKDKGTNVISTPKGGKYKVVLSDGTKVWLNAASDLKFPAVFGDEERLVELSGEAYFEVAKGKKPFKVNTGTTVVEVLGTHFNVMAYEDEAKSETTLLEGSVNIIKGSKSRLLVPGEKSICTIHQNNIKVEKVDVEFAIGWKEGLFTFNNTPIEQVMRQIGRSYDADVIYEGEIPSILFTGVIPVRNNASKALGLISDASGIKFSIEGKKIVVKN